MTDDRHQATAPRSWIQKVLDRRVLQVLGLYLGASWGVIQFVQWAIERYGLAPNLDHVAFVTCISLVPSIVILTWYHGESGDRGHWTRVEKIGIPANLLFTATVLFLVVRGGEADAATRTVTLTDEEGNRVEKVVPKSGYRRRVAFFGLENLSGDPDLDWLEDGITTAVAFDLTQNLFVETALSAFSANQELRSRLIREGFPSGAGMPLALQREVAEDLHMGYFTSGSFSAGPDGALTVKLGLVATATGQPVAEHELEDGDLFALADELSRRLRRDLAIPEAALERAKDLPVAELLTASPEAYELTIRGLTAAIFDNDVKGGRETIERALASDPTFSLAHFIRSSLCTRDNDAECAVESIEAAMRYAYRLPESLRFEVKNQYFLHKGDQGKRVALMKMRAEMFPDDPDAHVNLAQVHVNNRRWVDAVAAYERALEVSPESYSLLLTLSEVHLQNGDPEAAREYLEAYASRFPDEARSYTELGRFHERTGDYASAKGEFEKGLLLEPENVSLLIDLGDAERGLGDWPAALGRYEEALASSESSTDRMNALSRLEHYHRTHGQIEKALGIMERRLEELRPASARITFLTQWLVHCHHYVEAGREEKGWEVLRSMEAELTPPFDRVAVIGYLLMYIELGDVASAEARLEELDRLIEEMGDQLLGIPEFRQLAAARLLERKEDFEGALAHYRKSLELNPRATVALLGVLRCQRLLGRHREAERTRADLLRFLAYDPRAHYEAALLYADSGDRATAIEHLETATEIWAAADPGFEPARQARSKLEELSPSA